MHLPSTHPLAADRTADSRLVRALLGTPQPTVPVWFMRQAGRSLPEYRALRVGATMLDACLTPALASEITLQPVRRHRVDAAILFSDIVVPLRLAGVDVEIVPGRGPVFAEPVRSAAAVARLVSVPPERVRERAGAIAEAVRLTTAGLAELAADRGEPLPLIGFAGAPFTLAAYLVDGGPSKDHLGARRLIHEDPPAWRALTEWLARVAGEFLAVQVEHGASAVQLFDSWAGSLSPADYHAAARDASALALAPVLAMRPPIGAGAATGGIDHVPTVHFGAAAGHILDALAAVGTDAVGVDHRVPLDEAAARLGRGVTLQGNLDPAVLFAPPDVLRAAVHDVLERGAAARAHVFNLGHGVPQETDPDVLTSVVRLVHDWRRA